MLICPQCQFENPPSNRFCQVCGFPLPAVGSSPEATESASSSQRQDGELNRLEQAVVAPETVEAVDPVEERPSLEQTLGQPGETGTERLPIEAFATLPPAQADYHQSLKQAGSPENLAAMPSSSSPSVPCADGKAIPDGLAGASRERGSSVSDMGAETGVSTQTAVTQALTNEELVSQEPLDQEPAHSEDLAEETWEESTVWTGSDRGGDDDLPTVVLPMQLSRLDSAGASHVGRQRDHNEDNFDIQTEILTSSSLAGQRFSAKGLYILCDGMGGHSGGEVASAMVVEELKRYFAAHWQEQFPDEKMIRAAIASANKAVYDANESDERLGCGRMGTTLVLVLISGIQVAFAHVGDSRLYTYSRRQGLIQRTVDHEVGQLDVMRGVEPEVAYGRPESYQLTQALGPKDSEHVNPGLEFMELQEDTLFLLCSDGLSDYSLVEDHAAAKVAPLLGSQAVLEQGVSDLVHLANELSGHDNITAVAIRVKVRPDSKSLA